MNVLAHTGSEHHASARHGRAGGPPPAADSGAAEGRLGPEEINRLPVVSYGGPIHLVNTASAAAEAVGLLRREHLLGFDTEKRPSFRKGESHPPALLQLAGRNAVYLFHIHRTGFTSEVAAILADARIVKAGVAIDRDLRELRALRDFEPRGFVDLGVKAKSLGLQHYGLRGLAACLLGLRVTKGARFTNWEQHDLPKRSVQYAAIDAWIGRRIFEAMNERGGE